MTGLPGPAGDDRFTGEQAALRRVATLVARGTLPAEVFAAVTEEAGRVLGADYAAMARYDPDRARTMVAAWSRSGAAFPVGTRAELGGRNVPRTAIANAEAQNALTASRARVVATADATRRRIERSLHDSAQQRLVTLALDVRAAQADAAAGTGDLVHELDRVAAGLDDVLEDLREIARGLHPAILAESGLQPALKTLARRSAVPVDLDIRVKGRLPKPVETAAYYTISEALTNTAKHARATSAQIEVTERDASCTCASATTGAAARTSATGPGWSGSKTGPKRSAATSTSTARPGQAPPWISLCP